MRGVVKKKEDGKILLELCKEIYDKSVIIASTYKFTDKVYIHIDSISDSIIGVFFQAKDVIKSQFSHNYTKVNKIQNIACQKPLPILQ